MHLPSSRYGYKKTTTPYQTYRTEARPQPLTYYNYHPAAPVRVAAPVKAVHAPVTRTQHKQAYPQPFTVFNHQPVTRVAAPVKAVHTPFRANPAPLRPIPTPVRAAPSPVTRTGPTQIETAWGKFIKGYGADVLRLPDGRSEQIFVIYDSWKWFQIWGPGVPKFLQRSINISGHR